MLKRYFAVVFTVQTLTLLIPSFSVSGGFAGILLSSLILFFLYFVARPLVNLVALPINLLTLNLFAWVINIILFYVWILLSSNVNLIEFEFLGFDFGAFKISAISFTYWQTVFILGILTTVIHQIIKKIID